MVKNILASSSNGVFDFHDRTIIVFNLQAVLMTSLCKCGVLLIRKVLDIQRFEVS